MKKLTPTEKQRTRKKMAFYFDVSERNRLKRSYSMQRYYTGLHKGPDEVQADDCSAYAAKSSFWTMHETGIFLPDPLNCRYSGAGNTGTSFLYVQDGEAPVDKYLAGDLAFFSKYAGGKIIHMSICKRPGTLKTAVFSSNGHESWVFTRDAPEPIRLADEAVRQHLVGVFRPPILR